ncbi:MAG: hypothetical protein O7C03_04525 [Gammaproteobacteria bacterium]|nr:hypothetical protein [Gammaproteobacteria bacterium]MCZ6762249.1 hypothetical protein [Gammaproteobacteria bacterium]
MKIKIQTRSAISAILLVLSAIAPVQAISDAAPAQSSEAKEAAARLAVDALSKKLSVEPDSVEVVHVAAMEWPNSSLGCPRPGMQYLQVITRGWLALLQTGKKAYRVHIGNKQAIVCDKPLKSTLPHGPTALAGMHIRDLMQTAKKDLAQRLGVAPTEVSISRIESVTWPDSALGCPVPEQEYIAAEVRGFRITLDHNGQSFRYHTDQKLAFPCPSIERE